MHGRAIHREHPQPTPLLTQPEAVNLLLQEAIETFKYLGVELFARFAEGLRSDHLRLSRRLIEYAIELIEFGLQGRARLIEQEGVVCGRGRNPTLRLWPTIFSGKIDVFPGDRRSRLISSMTSVAPA